MNTYSYSCGYQMWTFKDKLNQFVVLFHLVRPLHLYQYLNIKKKLFLSENIYQLVKTLSVGARCSSLVDRVPRAQ